jgi:hypothetical protein
MFLDNEYTNEYYAIINRALARVSYNASKKEARTLLGYVEHHHIIPKSLGGLDLQDNMVWLTAPEHLKAHLLLVKMVVNPNHRRSMALAAVRMSNPQSKTQKRIHGDDQIEDIAAIREEAAKLHSEYMKEKHKGEKNPFYGRTHTDEAKHNQKHKNIGLKRTQFTKDNIAAAKQGDKNPGAQTVTCPHCGTTGKAGGMRKHHFDHCKAHLTYTFNHITGAMFTGTKNALISQHLSEKNRNNVNTLIRTKQGSVKGWTIENS